MKAKHLYEAPGRQKIEWFIHVLKTGLKNENVCCPKDNSCFTVYLQSFSLYSV